MPRVKYQLKFTTDATIRNAIETEVCPGFTDSARDKIYIPNTRPMF